MKKITNYLSLFILLLALGACGGDNATGPDPDPDPVPNPDPPAAEYETLDITVSLPKGSNIDLTQTTVMSLSEESEVTADGKAEMAFNGGTTQMAYLFDVQDNLLLAGFVSEDQPEINIETTTEVFFYIGFGTMMQPTEIRQKFIAEVRTIPGFDVFATEMEQLFLTNPRMFQEGDYAQPLKAKVDELQQRETIDIPTNQLRVDGADIRSGLQLADVDFEHFTITNNYRRRAHAFIYKTAFKDENGKETVLISEIESGTTADKDTGISPTGAIREFLGVFADWASGKAADFAATTTDPIQLPLAESESEATYKVRVVGPGVAGINRDFDSMSSAEEEKFTDLHIETFLIDFFLPLFLDLKGHEGLLKKANLSKQAVEDLKNVVEPALASTPAAYEKIKEGKFTEAMSDYMNAYRVNAAGSGMKDLLINLFEFFGKASPNRYIQNREVINGTIGKFTKIVGAIDIGLKAIDYGRLLQHIDSSYPLEEWTVKAKRGDVTLTPKEQVAIPFARKELQVITKTELSEGAVFQYEWSTSGKYGTLSDDRGHSGTSFTSSSEKVTYRSEMQSDQLGDGENIDEIYVTVFIKKPGEEGEKLTKVNTDTARINVQPFKYEIRPDGITMEGGNNVKLRVERIDGFNDIGTSDVYDYKVIWTTGATYGMLEGSQTTVTKYNSDSITYEALDEDVEEATENFTARIYFKSKDKENWVLLDEVDGTVKVKNDDNLLIFHRELEVVTWESEGCRGRGDFFIFSAAVFEANEKAENYAVRIFDYSRTRGLHRTFSWNAEQSFPDRGNLRFRNGSYYAIAGWTIVCGGPGVSKAQAAHESAGGWAEIIIELKDEGSE